MKKHILILIASAMMIGPLSYGQTPTYKVVFDITSTDPASQKQVVRDVGLIKESNPNAQLEVVVYGQALNLIQKDKSPLAGEIKKLVSKEGISFKACHESMKRNHVDKSQLITGVEIVPDGIYEIITKQKEGWGYIKIAQ